MKTILLAIGAASIVMFGGLIAGLIDPADLSVKAAYVGVFVGGGLFGAGAYMGSFAWVKSSGMLD